MPFFQKRHHNNLPPIDASLRHNNADEVMMTLEKLALPKEHYVVTGSAALTLLGLERQAHDVDLVVEQSTLEHLLEKRRTQNNDRVTPDRALGAGLPKLHVATEPLESELMSHQGNLEIIDGSPVDFNTYLQRTSPHVTDDGTHIINPGRLLTRKTRPIRIGDNRLQKLAQDQYDAALICRHLEYFQ